MKDVKHIFQYYSSFVLSIAKESLSNFLAALWVPSTCPLVMGRAAVIGKTGNPKSKLEFFKYFVSRHNARFTKIGHDFRR